MAFFKPLQNQAEGISPEEQKDATKSLLLLQRARKVAKKNGSLNSRAVKTVVSAKVEKTGVSTPTSEEKQEYESENDDTNDEQSVVSTFSGGRSEDGRINRRSIVDSGHDRGSHTSQDAKRRFKKARVLPSEDLVDGGDARNARITGSPHPLK